MTTLPLIAQGVTELLGQAASGTASGAASLITQVPCLAHGPWLAHVPVLLAAEGGSAVQFRVDTFIFSFIVLFLLILVLWKFAWNPIAEGLDRREQSIADDIMQAKQANEKAQATLAQYEHKIAAAQEEAVKLLAEAKQEAQSARQRILAQGREQAQRERERAIAEIHAAKDQALRELAEHSVDSAIDLAKNLIGRELDSAGHSKLIEESLDRFARNQSFSAN